MFQFLCCAFKGETTIVAVFIWNSRLYTLSVCICHWLHLSQLFFFAINHRFKTDLGYVWISTNCLIYTIFVTLFSPIRIWRLLLPSSFIVVSWTFFGLILTVSQRDIANIQIFNVQFLPYLPISTCILWVSSFNFFILVCTVNAHDLTLLTSYFASWSKMNSFMIMSSKQQSIIGSVFGFSHRTPVV